MTGTRYQGIVVTKDGRGSIGYHLYTPLQRGMMEESLSSKRLPDGERVLGGRWLKEPVDWKGIQDVKFDLLRDLFSEPKRNHS